MLETEHPVDVIAMYSAGGEIVPLRLRITDENRQYLRVDIDEIMSSKKVEHVGLESHIFMCRATVQGRPWQFELRYTIRNHHWSLCRCAYGVRI